MKRHIALLAGFVVGGASLAGAQERSFGSCWLRPAPLPQCRAILVTEASVEIPIVSSSYRISAGSSEKDFGTRFVLTAGFMGNLANDKAAGVVIAHDVNRSFTRIPTRVEGRFRWWQGISSVDVSAGVARKGFNGATGDRTGFTAAVSGERRYVGVDLRGEVFNVGGTTRGAAFGGVHASSAAAPVAALLTFGAVAALIIATGAGY